MIEKKAKPIRVLHVFNYFNQGGIENFVMNVYRNIDRSKVQFDFAFPTHKKGYFDDEALSLGANIYFFDSDKKGLWNYYRNLKRIINEHGPYAAVHSHVYYFSGYILLIAKLCGVKIRISHSHETSKGRRQTIKRMCYERFMRWMIKKNATNWLSCSDLAGRYVFGSGIPYQILYNGIDLNRFKYNDESRLRIRKQLNAEESFIVLNVGRFAPQKNHAFIIALFNELLRYKPNSKLILIGTGPLQPQVEEQCQKLGIKDKVSILHNIQNAEEYYNAADVFILPSLYEGMPIVSVEAQSTGLQTFISDKVTREVGITDIVNYLPISGNENQWAEKLMKASQRIIVRSKYHNLFTNTPFNVKVTVQDLITIYTSGNE